MKSYPTLEKYGFKGIGFPHFVMIFLDRVLLFEHVHDFLDCESLQTLTPNWLISAVIFFNNFMSTFSVFSVSDLRDVGADVGDGVDGCGWDDKDGDGGSGGVAGTLGTENQLKYGGIVWWHY